MKVLILHEDIKGLGGIEAYYKKMSNRFTKSVNHFTIGRRIEEKGLLSTIYRLINDYIRFMKALQKESYDIIHVNPSMGFKGFYRESIFLLLARMHKKKTIVFFHGWQESFANSLERNGCLLFRLLYGKTDTFIVLADKFKKKLVSWGCIQPIYREVTLVDDSDLQRFDIHHALAQRLKTKKWRILFLSRIFPEKGIYETIDTFSILQRKYPNIELVIAGDGAELERVKELIRDRSISSVLFTGWISGEEKNKLLQNSHVLCFPTYHDEGLPTSIIESMAFGLPIITRPVGGIADFFQNGIHGFLTDSNTPSVLSEYLENLYLDKDLYSKISLCNYQYAQSHFLVSRAVQRIEKIYEYVLAVK